MGEILRGNIVELIDLIGSALGAVLFTFGGFLVEQAGISNVAAGATTIGLWEAGMGALLLFVGLYLFGYERIWARVYQRAFSS
jgi:lipopolysaccharide export LptBFGC system permease protein LptF